MESHPTPENQPNAFAAALRSRIADEPDEPAATRHWRTWEPAQPYVWLLGAVLFGALVGVGLGLLR